MENKRKQQYLLVAFGVILFAALMNLDKIWAFTGLIIDLLLPVIIGLILAFVINIPMKAIQNRIKTIVDRTGHKLNETVVSVISLLLTLMVVIFIIAFAVANLIPALTESAESAMYMIKEKWPQILVFLESMNINTESLYQTIENADLQQYMDMAVNRAGNAAGYLANFAGGAVNVISAACIGFVISIYVLVSKKSLSESIYKITHAFIKRKWVDRLYYVSRLMNETYAKFLSGQCLEACILGSLMAIAFSVFKLPYAGLVGMLTAISAFVPYVGAFSACVIAVVLTLLTQPNRAIICVLVFLGVQFIENQIIYPHVVGNSVGMPPLLTLLAVLLGGKLFGLIGMIMFIPIMSVIVQLLNEATEKKITAQYSKQEGYYD